MATPLLAAASGQRAELPPVATPRRDGEPIPLLAMARCVLGEPMQLLLDVRDDGFVPIRATTAVVRIRALSHHHRG